MAEFNAYRSGGGATRRNNATSSRRNSAAGPLNIDIDAPPKPWPFAPIIALAVIICFLFLQLMPATHYRDPFDPYRQWRPHNRNVTLVNPLNGEDDGNLTNVSKQVEAFERIHIFSLTDDSDLRPLAVLVNSTICSSWNPEHVYFHLFLPNGSNEEDSHHKLKALFPKSNIETLGDNAVRKRMKNIISDDEYSISDFWEFFPFYIPKIYPNLRRFIYLAPDMIVKDKSEDLFQVSLGNFPVAAVEDCSQNYSTNMNFEVINAIQRSGAKPWVAKRPYEKNTCVLDLNVLLIDAENLAKENLVEAMEWWRDVLHPEGDRDSKFNPAILLALYGKYLKLDAAWNIRESTFSGIDGDIKILQFDGEKKPWLEQDKGNFHTDLANFWWHYLSPLADQLLRQPTVS